VTCGGGGSYSWWPDTYLRMESMISVVEGGELKEEVLVSREDLQVVLVLEEVDRVIELLGNGD